MPDLDLPTTDLLGRARQGDRAAADEACRRAARRLEQMARQMLHGRADAGAEDLARAASGRLLDDLRDLPAAPDYFRRAAALMRRQLLDLARRPDRPQDEALVRWRALHEAAEALPDGPREVFDLRFYHALGWPEVAAALGLSEAVARRRWHEATLELLRRLGDDLPAEDGGEGR
jgi:DNA-directed RNA polymerase specialized sigma24 family protein